MWMKSELIKILSSDILRNDLSCINAFFHTMNNQC